MKAKKQVQIQEAIPLKLDLGCGPAVRHREGFIGVDILSFDGVDIIADLREPWPWADDSVEEAVSSHFVEHLTGTERIHFFNELHRVMKKGATALIVTPDWSHDAAYGDPTHAWPPMSRWYVMYLNKAWRDSQAPHVPYTCDFDYTIGGAWDNWLEVRNQEFQMFATQHYVNSLKELWVTLTKR